MQEATKKYLKKKIRKARCLRQIVSSVYRNRQAYRKGAKHLGKSVARLWKS